MHEAELVDCPRCKWRAGPCCHLCYRGKDPGRFLIPAAMAVEYCLIHEDMLGPQIVIMIDNLRKRHSYG